MERARLGRIKVRSLPSMPLTKVPLLVLGVICTHIAWIPPNPPVKKNEVSIKEFFVGSGAAKLHSLLPIGILTAEALVLSANALSTHNLIHSEYLSKFVSTLMPRGNIDSLHLTTPFLIGATLICFGGYFRWACYRALGKLFTFEVTITKEHKLITAGPYSVVRHPSYTAYSANVLGLLLVMWSRGSWLRESGFLETTGWKILVSASMLEWVLASWALLVKRPKVEDELLRQEFGREWNDWAERVPWRLIPGIY